MTTVPPTMTSRAAIAALTLGLLCLGAATAAGQTPERVPHVGEDGQKAYQTYLTLKANRAFVISERGGYGTGFESSTPEAAIGHAMGPCRRRDPEGPCRIYSLNGTVVWGRSPAEIAREFGIPPASATHGAQTVPHLGGSGQEAYQRYLGTTKDRRAFAISQDGGFGWGDNWSTNEGAMKSALDRCQLLDPEGACSVYSLNGRVVWGQAPERTPRQPPEAAAALAKVPTTKPPVMATGPVPHINTAGQQEYERYRNARFHRAFYISETGGYGAGTNAWMISDATRMAAQNCERRDPRGSCKPYAIDGYVVWGHDPNALPRYADAPQLGVFLPSDYTPVLGPEKAKGVVVWSHGYRRGADVINHQPEGYVSRFLADGWDVYRFNREWVGDADTGSLAEHDVPKMLQSIEAARAAGYKKIVMGGASHGGWMSLLALAHGARVDGVVAVVPGKHGYPPLWNARSDFQQLLREIRSRANHDVPAVFVFFHNDAFDPGGRHADVADILGASRVRAQVIDRPAGFVGHGAGNTTNFSNTYGPCIFRFITGGTATASTDCR